MKRFIATMLVVMMLVTMMPTSVFAENTVEPTATPVVTVEPTAESSEEPAVEPTEEPAAEPTEEPVVESTEEPVVEPTEELTVEPTKEPIVEPTEEPVVEPTEEPVVEPTEEPVVESTEEPVVEPTEEPVVEPTEEPIVEPTGEPVVEPTEEPIVEPTEEPVVEPTEEPIEEDYSPAPDGIGASRDTFSTSPLTIDDIGVSMPSVWSRRSSNASYLNPRTIVMTDPSWTANDFDGYSTRTDGNYDYPFSTSFTLASDYMPQSSVWLFVRNYDVDEQNTGISHVEYDQVYVNGNYIGILSGENEKWCSTKLRVPVEYLNAGTNTITIYVGQKYIKDHQGYKAGETYRDAFDCCNSCFTHWAMTISQVQVLCDGGDHSGMPEVFRINLENAVQNGNTVECSVSTTIRANKRRNLELEYSLVDYSSEESASYGQIIASDIHEVTGADIDDICVLPFPLDSMSGDYYASVFLRDADTEEILAIDERVFPFTQNTVPSFDVKNLESTLSTVEYTNADVVMRLSANIDPTAGLSNISFYVNNQLVADTAVDADGKVTGTYVVAENNEYLVELRYTKDGIDYTSKLYKTVENIDKVIPTVNFAEQADGSIVVTYLDDKSGIASAMYATTTSSDIPATEAYTAMPVSGSVVDYMIGQYVHYTVLDKAGNTATGMYTKELTPLAAPVLNVSGDFNIAEGEPVSIDWNQVENATAYSIIVWDFTNGADVATEVDRVNDQEGLTYSYTFNKAGAYIIGVYSRCPGSTEYCQSRTAGSVNVYVTANVACDHSDLNYEYVLDTSIPVQHVDTGDGANHYLINSYSCICKDCGAFIGTVIDEYLNAATEAHTYDANGTCVCGYVKIPNKLGAIRLNVEQDDLVIEESFAFTWNEVADTDHYLFSLRDITESNEGPLLYERKRIEADAEHSITAELTAGRRYRAWICAVPEGMEYTAPQSSTYSAEFDYRIVPDFEVTSFDGNGQQDASGTLKWTAPTSKNGIVVSPDNYVIYVYHSDDNSTKQVYDAVVDGTTTSLMIDGSVAFTEYGLYTIAVYATMYESWGGPFHAVADLTPAYKIAAPDESKITASGIMLSGKHQRNNIPVYTGTYTFWAAGNDATTEIFADNNVSMKREGEYNGNPRFVLENVRVSEGIGTYKFHTANGSSNGIKIYGVTKYDAPKTKYVIEDGAALRYMPEKSSSVIGSLELAAEVKAYGEIDISSNEGYEYISYNGAYYFVEKAMVSDAPIKEDVVDIFTASGSEFFSYGEDIELKWKVDIEGENLTGKIDVCHKNIAGYFDGIGGITGKKLASGSWDITESVLENDEEGLYYANLKVYDGDKLVAEDIVYFTVSYDVNMTFLDNLDRDDLELWLDNQNPRENWDEYKRGGFLLLEETLEDNWGGWIHEGAYQVYQFGMDILGLDLIGLGLDIYELTDDDKEIEALLLENYALYLSSIQSELALIEEEAKWSQELYKWYDILSDGWDSIGEDIPDFGILNEFMGGEKIDIIHFVSLHTSVKLQLSESIADFYLWAGNNEKAHKWIERALSECAEIDLINIKMQNPKYISLSNKLNRSVEIGSHVISLVGLGLDIKEAVDKQGIAAEKYEEIISIIAQYQEGYLDILDSYIAAADASRKSALENFKNSIHSISVEMSAQAICDIAKTYADNETADDWREVGGSIVEITVPVFWEATKLIVEVYCENYKVPLPKWLNKLSDFEIDFSVTDWIGFGISLTDELLLHIDDKEAVLKEMLYYEQLKADLAEATLDEFDVYRRNNHTIEQANKIITALKFMKQLKYSGEYKALELCALLTDYYNYSDSQYTRVYKINGSWCAIGGYGIQELAEDEVIEEIGYVLSATISLNGSSAGDTMITIGGAVVSPLVGVSEEEILTSEELAIALEQDALFMEYIKKSRETNPDNYDWWVKYVEDNTSSRIESLDIP